MKPSKSKDIKKSYEDLVSKARAYPGVEELMKVYERFEKANATTEEFLQLTAPTTHESTSSSSLMP